MQKVQFGSTGFETSRLGVGLSEIGSFELSDQAQATNVLNTALDNGINFLDTSACYGISEELVGNGVSQRRDDYFLATKAGHVRTEGGGWDVDSSATHLESAVEKSLERLGGDHVDLWQHHRPDPTVPYEEVVETLKRVHDAGKVRMVGLSNANPEQIRLARSVLGDALVSVQNQFSPAFRSSAPEIEVCAELGLAFLPWSPLGGLNSAKGLGDEHPAFAEIASERGVSPQQVALAWELAQDPCVIPIPGAKRPSSITDSAAAADLELSAEELARLDAS